MQSRAWCAEARERTRRERKKPDPRAWVCSSLGRGLGSNLVGNGLIWGCLAGQILGWLLRGCVLKWAGPAVGIGLWYKARFRDLLGPAK